MYIWSFKIQHNSKFYTDETDPELDEEAVQKARVEQIQDQLENTAESQGNAKETKGKQRKKKALVNSAKQSNKGINICIFISLLLLFWRNVFSNSCGYLVAYIVCSYISGNFQEWFFI